MKNLETLSRNQLLETYNCLQECIYVIEHSYSHISINLGLELKTLKKKSKLIHKQLETI